MKKNYLLLLFIAFSIFANAQTCFWARSFGGPNDQAGNSIVTDDSSNTYTIGYFRSTVDFDPGSGTVNLTSPWYATFITKLDAAGNLVWAKKIGSAINIYGSSNGTSISIDKDHNIYAVGSFQDSCDFDPDAGTTILVGHAGGGPYYSTYTCKLNSAGNLIWATTIGGTFNTQAMDVTVDQQKNVYTVGSYYGITDFDPGTGVYKDTSVAGGNTDIYITKSDSLGNFIWAKTIGGSGSDNGWSIALDNACNVYSTGRFQNTVDFDFGSGTNNLTAAGGDDMYLNKLDSAGNYIWAKRIGGVAGDEMGVSIALDDRNNILTTGYFHGTVDFNPGAGVNNLTTVAVQDVFISKLDSGGNYIWAKSFGGSSDDNGSAIATDKNKNIYVTGSYRNSVDFNPGAGIFTINSIGDVDVFISKLDSSGNFIWAKSIGGSNFDNSNCLAVDSSYNVYTTGVFNVWADFDPYSGMDSLVANGSPDIFISKINDPLTAVISSVTNPSCNGANDGSATVTAHGGSLPYTYSWNTSPVQTTATATNLHAGTDTVKVTEGLGCSYTVAVTLTQPPADSAKICMVTVDSASQHNIIVWDKTSFTDVDTFFIYREISTNNYQPIGKVPFDSLSRFIDTVRTKYAPNTGDPNTGTYRYKLKTKSICGILSTYSPFHNTIYFLHSGATFFWTQLYTIEGAPNPVSSYVLMRDDNSTGNFQPVGSVAGTQQTINDPLYSIYQNTATWRVETQWSISCTPTLRMQNGATSVYSSSLSNKTSNGIGVNSKTDPLRFNISPNPSNGIFVIETTNKNTKLEVYSLLGEKVYNTNLVEEKTNINLQNVNKGSYMVHLISESGRTVKKIIIE